MHVDFLSSSSHRDFLRARKILQVPLIVKYFGSSGSERSPHKVLELDYVPFRWRILLARHLILLVVTSRIWFVKSSLSLQKSLYNIPL
mmetsp:Transcript_39171/g.123485  ORF Transcript_39171/g.123485 Transcript_39171/m.123485 type:complete len:88 (+) Transcript_39171:796-1059(+)